jgi:hypothetical protein
MLCKLVLTQLWMSSVGLYSASAQEALPRSLAAAESLPALHVGALGHGGGLGHKATWILYFGTKSGRLAPSGVSWTSVAASSTGRSLASPMARTRSQGKAGDTRMPMLARTNAGADYCWLSNQSFESRSCCNALSTTAVRNSDRVRGSNQPLRHGRFGLNRNICQPHTYLRLPLDCGQLCTKTSRAQYNMIMPRSTQTFCHSTAVCANADGSARRAWPTRCAAAAHAGVAYILLRALLQRVVSCAACAFAAHRRAGNPLQPRLWHPLVSLQPCASPLIGAAKRGIIEISLRAPARGAAAACPAALQGAAACRRSPGRGRSRRRMSRGRGTPRRAAMPRHALRRHGSWC